MAVQKKKPKKSTSKNPNKLDVFTWTPKRKQAALLLSEGTKTYEEVAEEVRIHISTLWLWRKHDDFLLEVDRLTLENEKATKAGLLRRAFKALDEKIDGIKEDKNTYLDWVKFISDLQGHTKQKIELDANMKHEVKDLSKLTDEELVNIINSE